MSGTRVNVAAMCGSELQSKSFWKQQMMNAAVDDMRVAPLAAELPRHCRQDVQTLRRFVRSVLDDGMPAAPVSPPEFREVLLTGATGFVGRFVLRDLLRRDSGLLVHCVVRASGPEHGLDRLRHALTEAEIWDDAFASRIRVVVGDIAAVRFGLSLPRSGNLPPLSRKELAGVAGINEGRAGCEADFATGVFAPESERGPNRDRRGVTDGTGVP